jgi:aerobic carbon-monoxide dehydrogenase medium subunit
MKPGPFSFHAPTALPQALELLERLENAKLLAGGQSLVPMLNYRLAMPEHLIDLASIPELRGITALEQGATRIGAMTTQRIIEKSEIVATHCPLLIEALRHVGHQTTRNRGTIGGSLCHLDPAAELPLVAQVLEPELTIASSRGLQRLRYGEFPLGPFTPRLNADEILLSIDFPAPNAHTASAFEEFALRPGDFAIVAVAVVLIRARNAETIEEARIAISGTGPVAVRVREAERLLKGQIPAESLLGRAAEAAAAHPCTGDRVNPAEYRQQLVKVLTRRALVRACAC